MAAHEALGNEGAEPITPEDSFALRLVIIRHAFELTQAEAALRCGLDDGSWSNWERGTKPRGMDRIVEKISDALRIDRDWLMWGGPLKTGSFASLLESLPMPTSQGSLLDDDLEPHDFYSRPALVCLTTD